MQLNEATDQVQAGSAAGAARKRGLVRLLTLDDLDRRTRAARVARETRDAITEDLGGADRLSTLQTIMADNTAVLSCMIADLRTRWLRGEPIDPTVLATVVNTFNRSAAQLGITRLPRDVAPDLRSYLAGRHEPTEIEEQVDAEHEADAPGDPDDGDHDGAPASYHGEQPATAQVGDEVPVEGARGAVLRFTQILRDGREHWWIIRDSRPLEGHFSRAQAEARARVLVEQGKL